MAAIIGLLVVDGGVIEKVCCMVVWVGMVMVWVRRDVVMVNGKLIGSVVVGMVWEWIEDV